MWSAFHYLLDWIFYSWQYRALPSALPIAQKINGISDFKTLCNACGLVVGFLIFFLLFERGRPYFSEMRLPYSLPALLVLFLFSSSFPIFVLFMSSCVSLF